MASDVSSSGDRPGSSDAEAGENRGSAGEDARPVSGAPDRARATKKDRRVRVLGLVAAAATMVALAIVVWVAVDGSGASGGSDPSSERAEATDRGDTDNGGKDQKDDDRTRGDDQGGEDRRDGQPKELTDHLLSLQRREADDPLAKGAVDAPVVLIMYEDFRCPFCAKFATDVEPALESYVESGQLRLEWRDYPIFGKQSVEMAKAARAASQQDKFWEFYEVAYSKGDGDGKPKFPDERIRRVAEQAGVPDMKKFDRDRKDPDVMDEISVDAEEGQQIGVASTPAFLINTEPVLGAQPQDVFVSIIEEELKNS